MRFERHRETRAAVTLTALGVTLALMLTSRPAPAGVEEQRRRLPPPARDCSDPITGVWRGYEHFDGSWYKFTLKIERVVAGQPELRGEIESHAWRGSLEETSPPPCTPRGQEYIVDMPSVGRFESNRVSFVGQSWTEREVICGTGAGSYSPDGFSGDLIEHGTEFHSMSDDGVNPVEPVVFRRIHCGETTKPVPLIPETRTQPAYASGCGGCF